MLNPPCPPMWGTNRSTPPYWTYTTGVEFKAFRIITLFISGVNWWRSTTCQRTASRFWHTATRRIMYKKVVSDKLCVRKIRFAAATISVQYWEFESQIHIKHIKTNFEFMNLQRFTVGLQSAVGTATRYGLNGPGIETRWGWDFTHPSRTALGPTQPHVQYK